MNKLLKYGWSIVLGLSALTSCSSEEDAATEAFGPEPVKFGMYISMPGETRSVADHFMRAAFTEADSVGVFAYKRTEDGSNGELYAANVRYTYRSGRWTVPSDSAIMTEPSASLNFYAYYPYRADMAEYGQMPCNVHAAQNEVDESGYGMNYAASDVLIAKSTGSEAGDHLVDLNFSHAFAMVRVRVTGTEATDTLATVKLLGLKTQATIDAMNGTQASPEGEPADIGMLQVSNEENNMFYLAVVPAQNIAAGVDLVEVTTTVKDDKGKDVETTKRYPCKEDLSLSASASHTLVVVMGEEISFEPKPDAGGMDVTQWLESEEVEMDKVE